MLGLEAIGPCYDPDLVTVTAVATLTSCFFSYVILTLSPLASFTGVVALAPEASLVILRLFGIMIFMVWELDPLVDGLLVE